MRKLISIALFLFTGTMLSAQIDPSDTLPPERIVNVTLIDSTFRGQPDTNAVYSFAEVMPSFPGPRGAFQQYLADNIKYPEEERIDNKQGTVYISFTVEIDGSITDVHAVKEVPNAPGLTQEAIRVISQMPKWTPGEVSGRTVRVTMTQPITFVLQNGRKKKH